MQKSLIILVGALVVVFVGIGMFSQNEEDSMNAVEGDKMGNVAESLTDGAMADETIMEENVKEFTMTSFYEVEDGKPAPQFSLQEITVRKDDKVRIKVTNTKGVHDFTLHEYGIFEETPLNEEVTIEFAADKAGEFIYYCSQNGHRAAGQWGTLKVLE